MDPARRCVVTTAFDAKANLIALLQANLPVQFPGCEVTYGRVVPADGAPRIWVWVGEIEWDDTDPHVVGNGRIDETYRIVLTVEVKRPGDKQSEANDAAFAVLSAAQELLRVNRDNRNPLNLTGFLDCIVKPALLGEGQEAENRGAILISQVRIKARI